MRVCVWVCVYLYVYIWMHYYRLVIKYHQLSLQANNYIDLWLHSHQQNKRTKKITKKYLQWWVVEPDQFCWGARAKISVLLCQRKCSGHQLMSPTTSVTIFNWSPYLHFENAKLNLSNFTVISPFNTEASYTCIVWHSSLK